jgi:hypothetical protein
MMSRITEWRFYMGLRSAEDRRDDRTMTGT